MSKPLRAVTFAQPERAYSEVELQAAINEAYERGRAEAEASFHQERVAVLEEQKQILQKLAQHHETLVADFYRLFPEAVSEAVAKVLAGFEPNEQQLVRIVSELIAEAHPKSGGLEIFLSERDIEIFRSSEAQFEQKYPGICFVADPDLQPGDAMVRSRFGTMDGRISTKLKKLKELLE